MTAAACAAALAWPAAGEGGAPVTFGGRTAAGRYPLNAPPRFGVLFETADSDILPAPFDTVLFQGVCEDPRVVFEALRHGPGGSSWVRAAAVRSRGGRFWAKVVWPSAVSAPVRLRAKLASSPLVGAIDLFSVEAFEGVAPGEEAGAPPPPSAPPADPEPPSGKEPDLAKPPVHSRAQWGARAPRDAPVPHAIARLTQHHTAGRFTDALAETLEEVRFIQDFHQRGRGWSDIGYHFLIDGAGRIVEGRPEGVVGAHVAGHNTGNVGVSLLGHYHPPYDHRMTLAQRESLRRLGSWMRVAYSVAPETYQGHRDFGAKTECPGDGVHPHLGEIRDSFRTAAAALGRAAGRLGRGVLKGTVR